MAFCSKNEWISLKRDDPIHESTWIKGGAVKMIVHGYALKGKHSEKYVYILWVFCRAPVANFNICIYMMYVSCYI